MKPLKKVVETTNLAIRGILEQDNHKLQGLMGLGVLEVTPLALLVLMGPQKREVTSVEVLR